MQRNYLTRRCILAALLFLAAGCDALEGPTVPENVPDPFGCLTFLNGGQDLKIVVAAGESLEDALDEALDKVDMSACPPETYLEGPTFLEGDEDLLPGSTAFFAIDGWCKGIHLSELILEIERAGTQSNVCADQIREWTTGVMRGSYNPQNPQYNSWDLLVMVSAACRAQVERIENVKIEPANHDWGLKPGGESCAGPGCFQWRTPLTFPAGSKARLTGDVIFKDGTRKTASALIPRE